MILLFIFKLIFRKPHLPRNIIIYRASNTKRILLLYKIQNFKFFEQKIMCKTQKGFADKFRDNKRPKLFSYYRKSFQ